MIGQQLKKPCGRRLSSNWWTMSSPVPGETPSILNLPSGENSIDVCCSKLMQCCKTQPRPNRLTQWKLFRVLTQIVAPCLLHRLLQLAAFSLNQNSKSTRYTEHSPFVISAPCWGVHFQPKPTKTLKVQWRRKKTTKTFNMSCADGSPWPKSHQSVPAVCIGSDLNKISFDKPLVFAPKSQDTPKGNRDSFFGRKQFENTLCLGRISMNLIWYGHQNHFIAVPLVGGFNTSAVSVLLMYNNLIRVVKGRDQGWHRGV